ncbi:MAG: DUF4364 family protein [Christensenellaceae bacterium]|jgi:hypothetical protein|nr:DUF4364 family protein [Christensenellaceae bacterium]
MKYFVHDEMTRKILLLFIFEKMEIPLSESSLGEIVMSNPDWLSYMDYREALNKILEVKFIRVKSSAGDLLYQLTQDGRMCLSHFYKKIPASIRESITVYAKENVLRLKRSQEYGFDYFKNADGTHTIVLKIEENANNDSIFEIKMKVPTRTDAIRATKKWKHSAPDIYGYLLDKIVEGDIK